LSAFITQALNSPPLYFFVASEIRGVANIRELSRLNPSTMMLRLLNGISFSENATVLDAPCGFGRNAIALAAKGLAVVGADNDCGRLDSLKRTVAKLKSSKQTHRVFPVCADLSDDRWPFLESSFSAVVCVHFPAQEIIENLKGSLREGGYIYIETFGGQGGNYLQLPKAGELRTALAGYDLLHYKERSVGPKTFNSVVVVALAQKRSATHPTQTSAAAQHQ
jgi:SAM-dependent methyltransferase